MEKIIDFLHDFNVYTVAIRLVLALIFGGAIGMERGRQGRAAGMRTHILVSLGAALTVMIGLFAIKAGYDSDPLRIGAQVVSGIGFLGVGTILLKGRFQITGLTTAAGLWCAATIGLSLGIGFYEGAFIVFAIAMFTVTVMHKLEYRVYKRYKRFGIYVEIDSDENIKTALEYLRENFNISDIQVTAPRSSTVGNIGIEANIHCASKSHITRDGKDAECSDAQSVSIMTPEQARLKIESESFVVFAIESI